MEIVILPASNIALPRIPLGIYRLTEELAWVSRAPKGLKAKMASMNMHSAIRDRSNIDCAITLPGETIFPSREKSSSDYIQRKN